MTQFRNRSDSHVDPAIEDLAQAVIGAAIEVHRELGPGVLEVSYKRSLSHELTIRGIPHIVEAPVDIFYKGVLVGCGSIDILVADRLVLELKAVDSLSPAHVGQTLTYLRMKRLPLGLLINFNVSVLKDGIKRIINTRV